MQIEVEPPLSWKGVQVEDMSLEECRACIADMYVALMKATEVSMRALKTIQEHQKEKPVILAVN